MSNVKILKNYWQKTGPNFKRINKNKLQGVEKILIEFRNLMT